MTGKFSRRAIVTGALIAVVGAAAAGFAYATIPSGNVYTACMLNNIGTIRLIDKSLPAGSLMSRCKPGFETEISWGQEGPPGTPGTNGTDGQDGEDGVSPTVSQLPVGDPNCPAGGAAITDAAGSTAYVCSGQDGQDGAGFDGSFTSPNGQSRLKVEDTGIKLESAGAKFDLGGTGATFEAAGTLLLKGALVNVDASGPLSLKGALVNINGSACRPAARIADTVITTLPGGDFFPGGAFPGLITTGSTTVCIG